MKEPKVSYQAVPGITVTPFTLITLSAKKYNITVEQLMSPTRKRRMVEARQYSMYLIRKNLKYSQAATGAVFHKDHATVLHACRVINDLIDTNQLLN